jgi:hypothetical protein
MRHNSSLDMTHSQHQHDCPLDNTRIISRATHEHHLDKGALATDHNKNAYHRSKWASPVSTKYVLHRSLNTPDHVHRLTASSGTRMQPSVAIRSQTSTDLTTHHATGYIIGSRSLILHSCI